MPDYLFKVRMYKEGFGDFVLDRIEAKNPSEAEKFALEYVGETLGMDARQYRAQVEAQQNMETI